MRRTLVAPLVLLFAGALHPVTAQTKPASSVDAAAVQRLQTSLAQAQAKGDLRTASMDLHALHFLYRNDPAMQASINAQLAQINVQLQSQALAKAQAKAAAAQAQALSVPTPVAQGGPVAMAGPLAPAPVAAQDASGIAPIPFPGAGGPPPAVNAAPAPGQSKFARFMAKANQVLAQAAEMGQQKNGNPPPPNAGQGNLPVDAQSYPTPPASGSGNSYPAPPGVASQAPANPAPAAGVVIGYDANNQPIYATGAAAPAAPAASQFPPPPR